jgi:hypothetical protein
MPKRQKSLALGAYPCLFILLSALSVTGCTKKSVTLPSSLLPDSTSSMDASEPALETEIRRQITPKAATQKADPPFIGTRSFNFLQGSGTSQSITNGNYSMGGTDQGLEVRGDRYRYYDEGGEHEWQPIANLRAIEEGVVFNGENYWCLLPASPGAITCTSTGWQPTGSVGRIDADELSLGGVAVGDSEAEVSAKLGQPIEIQDTLFPQWIYRGVTIGFGEGLSVLTISTSDSEYCTPSGVCPGSAFSEVEKIYGTPVINMQEDGRYMEYFSEEAACRMRLDVPDDRVGAILINCQI